MVELNDVLPKKVRLLRMKKDDFFEISASEAGTWRNERSRVYAEQALIAPSERAKFSIRTAKTGLTYVIRIF